MLLPSEYTEQDGLPAASTNVIMMAASALCQCKLYFTLLRFFLSSDFRNISQAPIFWTWIFLRHQYPTETRCQSASGKVGITKKDFLKEKNHSKSGKGIRWGFFLFQKPRKSWRRYLIRTISMQHRTRRQLEWTASKWSIISCILVLDYREGSPPRKNVYFRALPSHSTNVDSLILIFRCNHSKKSSKIFSSSYFNLLTVKIRNKYPISI